MITFVTFRWSTPGYRSQFKPEHVATLRDMIRRHYAGPHRFLCVDESPQELDADIESAPLWDTYRNLPPPQGGKNPSCYVRLKMYSAEIAELVGSRFVMLDLDTCIVGDVTPLFDRAEDFVIWGDTNRNTYYNGGLVMMNAGARRQVWETFDPIESPRRAVKAQCFGSDQAWISYCLGPGEKKYTKADGVYSFRNDFRQPGPGRLKALPANARLISFHGNEKPWDERARRDFPWIAEHYVRQSASVAA